MGINGWCHNQAYIINHKEDVDRLPKLEKVCVVVQTTTRQKKWNELVAQLRHKVDELKEFNTICYATVQRQTEAESIAKTVDVMLVIGGKNSSNTKKLYNICKSYCENTFAIETVDDIDFSVFDSQDVVGITAGASTPDWIIKEVIEKMNTLEENNKEKINDALNEEQIIGEETETIEENDKETEEPQEVDSEELTTMEDFEETMISLRSGQLVKGTVLSVNPSKP